MKKLILALCTLTAPLVSHANDWDLISQKSPISVYFDRDSVNLDPQSPNIKYADLVFLFNDVQKIEEDGRTILLDYFRFGHAYDCAQSNKSNIVRMEGGLVSQPQNIERVPNPTLNARNSEFDSLRWDLVCSGPATIKPTYSGSLQGLMRQNSKLSPRIQHDKKMFWSVSRHTNRHLDLLNHNTLKKTSDTTYHVELYNMTAPFQGEYTIYSGTLDCQNNSYTLNYLEQHNIHKNTAVGALYFNALASTAKNQWTVNIQNNGNSMSTQLLSICNNSIEKPQFRSSVTEVLMVKNGGATSKTDEKIKQALKSQPQTTPFDFQFK